MLAELYQRFPLVFVPCMEAAMRDFLSRGVFWTAGWYHLRIVSPDLPKQHRLEICGP